MNEPLGQLLTEQRNPRTARIDQVSTREMLEIINEEDRGVAEVVRAAIPSIATFLDQLVPRIRNGGRLFYIGAGTSGRLGVLDASECPPTYNVPYEMVQGIIAGGMTALYKATEASEDSPDLGRQDIDKAGLTPQDTLVGIAASGRTPYVIGAVEYARSMGALTGALVCAPGSRLAAAAEYALEVPTGPEVVTGSTRMKAGTATKLVLNMISTGLMIRLGYTHGNLMVNVQPKNEKLLDRAIRIIAEATGVERKQAEAMFDAAGRNVKKAITDYHG